MLISQCVEDISRFAAGDMDLQHTTDTMATKKQILESDELLQQKRRAYYLSDEGFEEYKKFLSDPDQKKFCFKGYYYVEVKEQDDKELSGLMGRVVYE